MTDTSARKTSPAEDPGSSVEQHRAEPAVSGLKTARAPWHRSLVGEETGVLGALIVLVIVISAVHPGFLQFHSITSVLRDSAFIGLMAFGMVYLLSMQELDLSVGSIFGLTALICAMMIRGGLDPWLSALLALVIASGLGALNATIANVFRLPGIIVTLGTVSVFRGFGLIISGGAPVTMPTDSSFFDVLGRDILGIPTSIIVFVVLGVVLHVVYRWTRFGVLVRAVGSNGRAAEYAGIPVRRVRVQTFVLAATLSGLAGILSVAFFGTADPSLGLGQEIVVIAAAIIGGTALSGGSGTVIGAMLGAILITVINAGLVYFGVNANWGTLVTGLVIIGAVALDSTLRQRLLSSVRKSA
ncbi:ABC transporter permease [uncultured Microbacterium sp.]|uniref:ABC transporter permease n=1 Tax=uncultured Microbacterium sp. TaxID=191216 RepID=UPI0035CAC0E6